MASSYGWGYGQQTPFAFEYPSNGQVEQVASENCAYMYSNYPECANSGLPFLILPAGGSEGRTPNLLGTELLLSAALFAKAVNWDSRQFNLVPTQGAGAGQVIFAS